MTVLKRFFTRHGRLAAGLGIVAVALLVGVYAIRPHRIVNRASLPHPLRNYRTHFRAPLTVPHAYERVAAKVGHLPTSGEIDFAYLDDAIDDQGPMNACEAWTFARSLSYAYNAQIPHHHTFFSPRFAYDQIVHGSQRGTYLSRYIAVTRDFGLPLWSQMPYGSEASRVHVAAYDVDAPIPHWAYHDASSRRYHVQEHTLFLHQGAGNGGVNLIRRALSHHEIVAISVPVYDVLYNANSTAGHVDLPGEGAKEYGGHAMSIAAYDDSHTYGGVRGWFLFRNQWGLDFGVNQKGNVDPGHAGYVWISYRFVAQYAWSAAVIKFT